MQCKFCEQRATRILPQSIDEGATVVMIVACGAHAAGWWEAADWDGRHLEQPLLQDPNIIVFYEQGVEAGQSWEITDGQVGPHINGSGEKKMLCPHLCAEVEDLVNDGDYSGRTSNPRFSNWTLRYSRPDDEAINSSAAIAPDSALIDLFESRISQKLQEDPMLKALRTTIANATQALHLRENELVAQMKESMGLQGLTDFECLLGEHQIGVH